MNRSKSMRKSEKKTSSRDSIPLPPIAIWPTHVPSGATVWGCDTVRVEKTRWDPPLLMVLHSLLWNRLVSTQGTHYKPLLKSVIQFGFIWIHLDPFGSCKGFFLVWSPLGCGGPFSRGRLVRRKTGWFALICSVAFMCVSCCFSLLNGPRVFLY